MSTNIAVYIGIGQYNKGEITAVADAYNLERKVGEVYGSDGLEKLKLCNSVTELGEIPDVNELIAKRHNELIEKENERHQRRLNQINQIQAA